MRLKYLVLFMVSALLSNAQVPGYMGKRFSIGYSNYFMLSGIGPTANAVGPNGNIGVNTSHCFNLEYTIKMRTNFCLSVQSATTGVDPGEISIETYNPSTFNYESNTYSYNEQPYKPMQIQSLNIGLGFKFFQSGTIAPIGKYKKLELLMLFNHLTYKSNAFTYYDYNSNEFKNKKIGTGDYQFKTIAIAYTIGRSRVLFDRIVLDYGIRFGAVPAGVFAFLDADGDFISSSSASMSTETRFKYAVNTRLFRYQLFNFHIGLGFLAF